jgi:topoisomerase-4 subunit B
MMIDAELREIIYNRPIMFIGAVWSGEKWDESAIHALIKLVVQQMVDTKTGNEPINVQVVLTSDRTIVIQDDGAGLPVSPLKKFPNSTTPALMALLTWYIPTGRLSEEQYKEFGFISYFAMLLNVLSEQLQIDTVRDSKVYTVTCSRGEIVNSLKQTDTVVLKSGTRITFQPDSKHFADFQFSLQKIESAIESLEQQYGDVSFKVLDQRK